MTLADSVADSYLAVALMVIVALAFPILTFWISRFFRPVKNKDDPNKLSSFLLPDYEVDHTGFSDGLSTYECGSKPVGDAQIQFHFQYYWYALVFLVFDVAFLFLAIGGLVIMDDPPEVLGAMVTLAAFMLIISLGVWRVFRKRGLSYV